jgi:hypothetical protein
MADLLPQDAHPDAAKLEGMRHTDQYDYHMSETTRSGPRRA